jgi:hypothetical protein
MSHKAGTKCRCGGTYLHFDRRAPDADAAALRGLVRELVKELHRTGTDDSTLLARADALAGEPGEGGERSYSAAEVREAFVAGRRAMYMRHYPGGWDAAAKADSEAQALLYYPEKPQETKP